VSDDALDADVVAALGTVPDPEIPNCSIVDLGLVHTIEADDRAIRVTLLPTFAGCPALDAIEADARRALEAAFPDRSVGVRFSFEIPWTSDRISPHARETMKTLGIAPPGASIIPIPIGRPHPQPAGPCPYCSSDDTEVMSAFGPTPCRAVAYCRACRNPFEPFKRKGA